MHALPARPLKVQGGRGCSPCADGMESIFFAFSIGYIGVYIVGRELTDLRSERGRRRRDRASGRESNMYADGMERVYFVIRATAFD